MNLWWMRFVCVFLLFWIVGSWVGNGFAADPVPAYEDSTYRHDPYDLSKMTEVDSTDVYVSRVNHLLRLPQYAWSALAHPFGEFAIYAEHTKLWVRYFDLFTNADGTFGFFPIMQVGGETGHGGGARFFHSNLFGKRKIITGQYVYSGKKGQFGSGIYIHPNFAGKGLLWKTEAGYLQTRHTEANINNALDDTNLGRLFELKQVDAKMSLVWQLQKGHKAPFVPQVQITGWTGYGRRNFRPVLGGLLPLTHLGASDQAGLLKGLGSTYAFYRFGGQVTIDNRDYKRPVQTLSHPINYRFPGRIVQQFGDRYYFFRDLGYPERGGVVSVEGEFATGSDRIKFYRVGAEVAKYVTLFWKDRILAIHGRLDKVTPWDNGYVPYTDLIQKGGNESMRGYERGYFRGQGAIEVNIEYRYPIWDTWNAFLFWDEGQIFDHYADVTWGDFHSSWGGGIAFRTEVGLLGKVKIGHSAVEKILIGITFKQAF